jgi:hypothetical protein
LCPLPAPTPHSLAGHHVHNSTPDGSFIVMSKVWQIMYV